MPPHLLQPDSLAASHQSNKQDQGHHLEALPVAVHIRSLVRQAEKARCTHHTSRDPDDVVTDDSGPSQDSIRLRIRLEPHVHKACGLGSMAESIAGGSFIEEFRSP